MAIIYSYPNGGTAQASDLMVISRTSLPSPVTNPTYTLSVAQIAAFVQSQLAGGTPNYIPVFNTANTIVDSPLYLDDFAAATLLSIKVDTNIIGALEVQNKAVFNSDSAFYGIATFEGVANFQNAIEDENSVPGTSGQILSSTGSSVRWIDPALTGTGTINNIPLWVGTDELGDSIMSTDGGGNIEVAGNMSVQGFKVDTTFTDGSGLTGTAGQVLTSTGTGTAWAGGSTGTISGGGTLNKVAIFTPDGQAIGDSVITQAPLGQNISVGSNLTVSDDLTVSGDIETDNNLTVEGVSEFNDDARFNEALDSNGTATFSGEVIVDGEFLEIQCAIKDSATSLPTSAGQILVGDAAGAVTWTNPQDVGVSGAFREVNEGNGIGIVKQTRNPNNYAPVGNEAFDASQSTSVSSTKGAEGDYSVALGLDVYARGDYSFAFGQASRAFNNWDIVMGHDSEAVGGNSVAIGWEAEAQGAVSTAIGSFVTASGDNSIAFGTRLTATGSESNVFGKYNATTDELFVVGNGNNSTPSDLIIGKNNGVILAPSLEIGEILDPKCLITLEYITTIAAGIIGTGTEGTIPIWINGNPSVTIADSIITQTSNPNPKIVISGALEANGAVQINDTLAVTGVATFEDQAVFEAEANFQDEVTDSTSSPGTAGQVLSSTGDKVLWVDLPGGDVTGTGTTLTVPMWYGNNITNNLADSSLSFTLVDPNNLNDYGMQFGGNSVATGQRNSIAIGYDNQATAEATLATGHGTIASGLHAASFGFKTGATGEKSVAFNDGTNASGKNSFAIGAFNTAATSLSFAGGLNSTANPSLNGTTAFAYGNALNITGQDAAGFGKGNTATGKRNFVVGSNNQVAGDNSFAIGALNVINAGGAATIGSGNNISRFGGFAIGQNNVMDKAFQTAALGYYLQSGNKQYQTIVGYNNVQNDDASFVVGAGQTGSRTNGLEVYKDKVVLPEYGSGNVVGASAYNLEVTTEGKIIETVKLKKYVSLITQTGATAPTIITNLENTLDLPPGGFVGWTYLGPGEYNLELTGAFDKNKTVVFINGGSAENNHDIAWEVIDSDNLVIRTHNSNNRLTRASLEIRTY